MANVWQVCRQIQYLLNQRVWPEVGGESVMGAFVTPGPSDEATLDQLRPPFALINPAGATNDQDEPSLMDESIDVTIAVVVDGDAIGQDAIIGGNRSGGVASSKGRGLLEVQEEVLETIKELNQLDGVNVRFRASTAAAGALVDEIGYVASRTLTFDVKTHSARTYPAPRRFTGTALGGGNATLAWLLPPTRFDLYRIELRRASGATPPATPTDGTDLTLSTDLATGHADSPGAGTFSYSLFAFYDETKNPGDTLSSDDRFSAAATLTLTVT